MKKLMWVLISLLILSNSVFAQLGIVIDAEKDDYWATLTGPDDGYIFIPYLAAIEGAAPVYPDDDEDLSAYCWLGWDDDYLYFYGEITDDLILVNNATNYQNDAVELKMDPDPLMEVATGGVGWRLSSWGEDEADEPLGVDNLGGSESGLDPAWVPVEGEDYARKEVDITDGRYGYNLEFRIPWDAQTPTDLSKVVDVAVDGIFGLAINVMDNDESARTEVIQWSAGMQDAVWSNAQLLGTATFLADGKLELTPVNSAGGPDAISDPTWYIPETSAVDSKGQTVSGFELEQNYPNP
ncbi:hypothetical protein HQ585_12035, partial [candidate division KSB1 bacterium]|nr:hypothetical protein [candidate division KSB1 bacterium]